MLMEKDVQAKTNHRLENNFAPYVHLSGEAFHVQSTMDSKYRLRSQNHAAGPAGVITKSPFDGTVLAHS